MTDHLSPIILNALVDGELTTEQLVTVNRHLAECPACTSSALGQSLLKSATASAGRRYSPPAHLLERLSLQTQRETSNQLTGRLGTGSRGLPVWGAAAALLLLCISFLLFQRNAHRSATGASEAAALVTEVADQHIATLAAALPPQVLSSDRHTVKPWFQGKLPFSFNLPDNLPPDTKLGGANLTYLRNQPVAQLLYSVGKHRVSVFLAQRAGGIGIGDFAADHSGFHERALSSDDLQVIAVSDVDPARLSDLASRIAQAQTTKSTLTK